MAWGHRGRPAARGANRIRNRSARRGDHWVVSCDRWIEAISARADGEEPSVDQRLLAAHLARCAACHAFDADVRASRRGIRLREAQRQPDLSRRVVSLNAIADRAARWGMVRAVLAVAAVQILVLAVPGLVGAGASPHDGRHVGAFSAAYAVGLLVVVVRPARARTMLPVAGVLSIALALTAVIDTVAGEITAFGEVTHLPVLVSVVSVWSLTRPIPHPSGSPRAVSLVSGADGGRSEGEVAG